MRSNLCARLPRLEDHQSPRLLPIRSGPSERDARNAFTLTRPVRARPGARDRRHLPTFVITRAGTATGGLHPLCSKLSRHLLPRAAVLLPVLSRHALYTLVNIFFSMSL